MQVFADFLTSLVFSHWGKTLSCLEIALNERNISFVKIDGGSTREQKGMIIQQFQRERHIKIMLLTYASGSVGYVGTNCVLSLNKSPPRLTQNQVESCYSDKSPPHGATLEPNG